jgi:hypothetical protein
LACDGEQSGTEQKQAGWLRNVRCCSVCGFSRRGRGCFENAGPESVAAGAQYGHEREHRKGSFRVRELLVASHGRSNGEERARPRLNAAANLSSLTAKYLGVSASPRRRHKVAPAAAI